MKSPLALGLGLCAIAILAGLARAPLTDWIASGGSAARQRPLAGGTQGENPRVDRPVRVVLLDGLSRADSGRLGALRGLCEGGLDLTVDVGFPTKSLPVQRVLWSGLTAQQQGDRADNLPRLPPASAVPMMVPSHAVAESHAEIARDVGFGLVEPTAEAEADPDAQAAWEQGGFADAAVLAVAGPERLVMVHVLAIDVAAHRSGRSGAGYDAALAYANDVLARVLAAAPDAQWLVLADHGHVAGGGHGDVEDEVRRVRACWSPAPVPRTDGEVHLVDVARWLADAVGAPRHPRAVGRTLAVAIANPDRDATLPAPSTARLVVAAIVLALGLVAGLALARRRAAALWIFAAVLIVVLVHGVPTLSSHAPPALLWLVGLTTAGGAATWEGRPHERAATALIAPAIGLLAALAIASRTPAPTPFWTGFLGNCALIAAGGVLGIGVAFVALFTRQR